MISQLHQSLIFVGLPALCCHSRGHGNYYHIQNNISSAGANLFAKRIDIMWFVIVQQNYFFGPCDQMGGTTHAAKLNQTPHGCWETLNKTKEWLR